MATISSDTPKGRPVVRRVAAIGPAGSHGGLQTHHHELVRFLAAEGYDLLSVDILVEGGTENVVGLDDTPRVSRIRVGSLSSGILATAQRRFTWWRASQRIRRFQPDLIIASAIGAGYAAIAQRCKSQLSAVMLEATDSWDRDDPVRVAMRSAYDQTVVQSVGLRESSQQKTMDGRNIRVLPCFSAPADWGVEAKRVGSAARELRIAYFGRLAPNKGLLELVRHAPVGDHSNFRLDIWGSGPVEEELLPLIKERSAGDQIHMLGSYPSGREYFELLSKYDGLVLPSQRSEGLPLVLLEATSVGLPIFSVNVGAIGDIGVDNPDAMIVEAGEENLAVEFQTWLSNLSAGRYDPERMRSWYQRNHSRSSVEDKWRLFMNDPKGFFE